MLIRTFSTIIFSHSFGKICCKFFVVIHAAAFVTDACDVYLFELRKVISLEEAEFKSVMLDTLIFLIFDPLFIFKIL